MIELDIRRGMAAQARRWLGRKEADNSHREIIDIYNQIKPLPNGYRMKYSDPWCAAFLSAVAWLQGLTKVVFPSASCPDMASRYKAAGRWMEDDAYMPQIADVVFYDWEDDGKGDDTGTPDHVGLVVDVYSGSFNVIEGNSSDMVKIRTLKLDARYIRGFGLPDYAAAAAGGEVIVEPAPEDPVSDPDTQNGDEFELHFRVLRYGAGMGELSWLQPQVWMLQWLLIGLGYDLGPDGDDGEFGPYTENGVKRFQADRRLVIDGEAGPETMSSLFGLNKERMD